MKEKAFGDVFIVLNAWIIFLKLYQTAVPCCDTECFHCNLIVTMRYIPKDKLKECVQITHPMKKSHGAPIHIGSSGQCIFFFCISMMYNTKHARERKVTGLRLVWLTNVQSSFVVTLCTSKRI